jgi:hypothetical protein
MFLALGALGADAALAQRAPVESNQGSDSELWGTADRGEDKGRVQATEGSYNLTHIAYAAVLIAIMAVLLVWLIRRHSASRNV